MSEDQVQTDPRDDDRRQVALGQKMGLIFAESIRDALVSANWDSREKSCFWNGVMAEMVGGACSHLGFPTAQTMFNYIANEVVPKLAVKASLEAEKPKVLLQ